MRCGSLFSGMKIEGQRPTSFHGRRRALGWFVLRLLGAASRHVDPVLTPAQRIRPRGLRRHRDHGGITQPPINSLRHHPGEASRCVGPRVTGSSTTRRSRRTRTAPSRCLAREVGHRLAAEHPPHPRLCPEFHERARCPGREVLEFRDLSLRRAREREPGHDLHRPCGDDQAVLGLHGHGRRGLLTSLTQQAVVHHAKAVKMFATIQVFLHHTLSFGLTAGHGPHTL